MLYFLFTFCSINGWICLHGLQYLSSHKLQTPGRHFIFQQDHIDCSPIQTVCDTPTWSGENPQDTQAQPPPPCSHFQLWSSCIYILELLKRVHDVVKVDPESKNFLLNFTLTQSLFYKSNIQYTSPCLFSPRSGSLLAFTLPLFL